MANNKFDENETEQKVVQLKLPLCCWELIAREVDKSVQIVQPTSISKTLE